MSTRYHQTKNIESYFYMLIEVHQIVFLVPPEVAKASADTLILVSELPGGTILVGVIVLSLDGRE